MSAFTQSKNKFSVSNPKVGSVFQENDFFKWSEGNFYRTSTNDMSKEVRKSTCIFCRCQQERSQQLFQDMQDTCPASTSTTITSVKRSLSSLEKFWTKRLLIPQSTNSLQLDLTAQLYLRQIRSCTQPQEDLELKL